LAAVVVDGFEVGAATVILGSSFWSGSWSDSKSTQFHILPSAWSD